MKIFIGLVTVFITLPIWYFLLYKILVIVNATELMWFLYWIYMPVSVLMSSLLVILNSKLEDK